MKTSISLFAMVAATALASPVAAETLSDLAGKTHIHGLAFDRVDPTRIYIATHHGLLRATADGSAERISDTSDDFMGFVPHPSDPAVFYASGHPQTGGNLGFITSVDGGKTWKTVSPGADGPVDFHQLAAAPGDATTLYGAFRGIQKSVDAGASWVRVGDAPEGLIDLAVSASDPGTVYAATKTGLLASRDGAKSWDILRGDVAVTSINVEQDGTLTIFVPGEGLLIAAEDDLTFATTTTNIPDDTYLLHLAVDPANAARMIAVAAGRVVMLSDDGGSTWAAFGK